MILRQDLKDESLSDLQTLEGAIALKGLKARNNVISFYPTC